MLWEAQWTHATVERLRAVDDLTLFVDTVSLTWVFSNVHCHDSRVVQQTVRISSVWTSNIEYDEW